MPLNDLNASLKIILNLLPEEHEGQQRRQNALTRSDGHVIIAIVKEITSHQGCSIGLSARQCEAIRNTPAKNFEEMNDMVKERRRLIYALGTITLAILGFIGQQLFTKIHWGKIWESITK
jgi:hypothetical protein